MELKTSKAGHAWGLREDHQETALNGNGQQAQKCVLDAVWQGAVLNAWHISNHTCASCRSCTSAVQKCHTQRHCLHIVPPDELQETRGLIAPCQSPSMRPRQPRRLRLAQKFQAA